MPHVHATTREAAIFGLGYVAAEDRLFFMDVLRHSGRAQLSSFAGGAAGNRHMDEEQWRQAPYTEADLQLQADRLDDLYGDEGREVQADLMAYVAGVNAYIGEAKLDITKMPGEYAAIGRPLGPDPWKVTDVIATASLVGAIFGKGGGDELTQMEVRRSFVDRYGGRRGRKLWREWAAFEDADAPTTVRRKRFPYQTPPRKPARGALALADRDSLTRTPVLASQSGPPPSGASAITGLLDGLLPGDGGQRAMSNALWMRAQFEPSLGSALFDQLRAVHGLDNEPNDDGGHTGSAYQRGSLYADDTCAKAGKPGDQACFDAIAFRSTGGVTQPLIGWQNRPTYQMAVEVQGHRPR